MNGYYLKQFEYLKNAGYLNYLIDLLNYLNRTSVFGISVKYNRKECSMSTTAIKKLW